MVVSPDPGPAPRRVSASFPSGSPAARDNLEAALRLLAGLRRCGLRQAVIAPGSRSAPLAVAAALLEPAGLALHTAIDERSAAFFALGLGRASGLPAAVITSSGSAVAHLLAAAVEADHGTIPLLLLSADRPLRLKGCGANQSVNQETFLAASCRWLGRGAGSGLAAMAASDLEELALRAWRHSLGAGEGPPPGPVHLNLPFEEPLHPDRSSLAALAPLALALLDEAPPAGGDPGPAAAGDPPPGARAAADRPAPGTSALDPDRPGVVVAGPWRGAPAAWPRHLEALRRWQRRTGWPLLADALSGLRGCSGLSCVASYDLLLENPPAELAAPQILRLGPLPASRRLERWLQAIGGLQVLVSEADPRCLDPLATTVAQDSAGLATWLNGHGGIDGGAPAVESLSLALRWQRAERLMQARLDPWLGPSSALDPSSALAASDRAAAIGPGWSEPALARQLSLLLPEGLPLMLANSSPVRDWESFADPRSPGRPIFGFRGASGIDGTLSEACGIAEALGACLLLSGDLALLHDSNGWLWRSQLRGRLTVVLIDNGGGGIFEQLPIRLDAEAIAGAGEPAGLLDFDRLFAMPQAVDPLTLAAAHGVPGRLVPSPLDLPAALGWALEQPISLLVVRTDRRRDAELRRRLRTMAAEDSAAG